MNQALVEDVDPPHESLRVAARDLEELRIEDGAAGGDVAREEFRDRTPMLRGLLVR